MARKKIEPYDITAVVDTREQTPWDLSPLKVIKGTLPTGDYSILGLEHLIAIERKSLPDLIGCVAQSRERFDAEIQRLLAYSCRAIIVEATWHDLMAGNWRSKVTPQAAMGSVLGWIGAGVPIIFAGDAKQAGLACGRLMFIAARRRWAELQFFAGGLKIASGKEG